ncbi:glycerophosphodiester phosphodiesterase [Rhizobiaceae bacterium n13]|uniref:Glycerophosphodiester phosphodiesterase n=1 Tax=Ferirhizobium litorale TaxID=2927786 RepID=A0AAE3QEU9_9HYPH|nr:glycerophosphodiester phosphodiesterase [Fererhizobium litorale]MDI7864005.1 glycerophosphodiester phosphodiesterase [Fererhizobium litorale]MDI7924512.1 glycerophosphodiester phosphodiesterase [Fererhizobium litorale]
MTKADWLTKLPIAHRGFHDMNKTVWENTLSAFSRAIDAGYAIECDLQLAADGVPIVFHDDDLQRLCNIPGDVRQRTSQELGMLAVGGTGDRIPTLKQLLDLCQGKVPLVLELKGRKDDDEGFAAAVLDVLEGYKGQVALMSFDVWLLKDLKELDCPYPLGLTAEGNEPEKFFQHDEAMHLGLDFISYHFGHLPNPFITAQRASGIPVITWTVRDQAAREHTFANADQMTFEGFNPLA